MTEEMLKLVAGLGVGGVIGGIALWQMSQMRAEVREANQKNNDWLVLIFNQLGSLGAETIPPPVEPEEDKRRKRLRTAPSGVPIKRGTP